jgi:hypothetical protein
MFVSIVNMKEWRSKQSKEYCANTQTSTDTLNRSDSLARAEVSQPQRRSTWPGSLRSDSGSVVVEGSPLSPKNSS